MAYATPAQVAAGFRPLDTEEQATAAALLAEAATIIDAYNANANLTAKALVSCRLVRRALGSGDAIPLGATQGTQSALGYSQSWAISGGGASGELYLGKTDKKLLGLGDRIGASNPYARGGCV